MIVIKWKSVLAMLKSLTVVNRHQYLVTLEVVLTDLGSDPIITFDVNIPVNQNNHYL
jgi:hypothetical protein